MDICSNCNNVASGQDVLRVAHRGRVVAVICGPCAAPAAKPRITLSRTSDQDHFEYAQYVCVEALSSVSDVQED